MHRSGLVLLLAFVAGLALPGATTAAPINATYAGAVSDSVGSLQTLQAFPLGTPLSFDVTFDDGFIGLAVPLQDLGAASGTVNLGADQIQIDHAYIVQYSFGPLGINWWAIQLTGTGPQIGANGDFYGLFLYLTPALDLAFPFVRVGYGFTVPFATSYGYVDASDDGRQFSVQAVPQPPATLLMLSGLGIAVVRRFAVRVRR